jgi:hypothetical protein
MTRWDWQRSAQTRTSIAGGRSLCDGYAQSAGSLELAAECTNKNGQCRRQMREPCKWALSV